MKNLKIILSVMLLFWVGFAHTQNIIEAEYFFDTDPGIGNATSLAFTPGDTVDQSFNIPTSSLAEGFHTFHIRFRNDSSVWSMYESRTIYIQPDNIPYPTANLTEAEYFFDTDPGVGNGIPISITHGDSTDFIKKVSTAGLSEGFHTVFVRFRSDSMKWSMYEGRRFYVQPETEVFPTADLAEAEYFFDTDPGVGNGTTISFTPGDSTDFVTKVSTAGLAVGFHDFFIRFRSDSLKWSMYEGSHFYVQADPTPQPSTLLIGGEYFIDNDPGLGNGVPISLSPTDSLDVQLSIDCGGIDTGYHYVYARVLNSNNIWSLYKRDTFLIRECEYPHADFSTANICFGDTAYFTDLSINVDSTAVYLWDINNDGTVDYNTVGNIAHLYSTPGNYEVKLSVLNSGVCLSYIIKPLIVYSPQITLGNDTTICDCGIITLDAGAGFSSYLWSSGQTTSEISIIPGISTLYTVTVTDNMGCQASDDVQVNTYTCPGISLNVGVLLQGAYYSAGMMDTQLNSILPLTQPYNVDPWLYSGSEVLSSIPSQMVDWILVELRNINDFTRILDRRAGILMDNGTIVDTDLLGGLEFNCIDTGNYYIVIRHRNHLPVMSADPNYIPNTDTLNFSNITNYPPYGGAQDALIEVGTGQWGMIAGDVNQNYQLKYSGPGNDRGLVLQLIVNVSGSTSITTTINGYYHEDINMDGIVKYSGPGNDPSTIIQNLVTKTGSASIISVFITPVPQGSPP